MNQHKIPKIKNKFLRIFLGTLCDVVLFVFVAGVIIGIIGGYKYDIISMELSLWLTIISGIIIGVLHIVYFRTPKKWRKKLFEE